MLKTLLQITAGYRDVSASQEHAVGVLNGLRESGVAHWRMRNTADGGIAFRIRERDVAAFRGLCDAAAVAVQWGDQRGLPALLRRYRRRWGIPVGAAVFALLTALSCRVVWEVDVTGNEKLDKTQIIRMLSDYGFGVGSPFRFVDFDVLQNEFLLTTDEIAWISVNMEGTVARVQVRENLGGRRAGENSTGISNIVAAEDGQIVEVQIRGGKAAVAIHDVVRKGELLISGVIAVGEAGVRYEHASGTVLARVNRQIMVEIPKNQAKKVYTGEENVRKSLIFFGKEIKLFGKSSIDNPTYDTIVSENCLTLPGGMPIPVGIRTERDRAYRMEPGSLSDAEAYVAAMQQYREELDALLATAEILSVESEHHADENGYRITAHLVCVTDIAAAAGVSVP